MAPRKRQIAEATTSKTDLESNTVKANKKQKIKDEDIQKSTDKKESKKSKITKKSTEKVSEKEDKKDKNKTVEKESNVKIKTNKEDIKAKSIKKSKDTESKTKQKKGSEESKKRKAVDTEKEEEELDEQPVAKKAAKDSKKSSVSSKKKIKKEEKVDTEEESGGETVNDVKYPKSPQTTREMVRFAQKWVGAHVSIAGGLYKAVEEACSLESNAFGLFLRSQRRWESPPLAQKSITEFEKTIKEKNFGCSINLSSSSTPSIDDKNLSSYFNSIKDQILPHGSYLINLGNPDKAKREKSYTVFLDDLKRCDLLSIALYNFHPGSTCGQTTIENSIALIAENINKAHKETKNVKILIENMAGQGNIVGSKFEELADIIKLIENKNRIGICLDTCHLFAAGYDVRTPDAWNKTLNEFDKIIGLKYLSALHLNDSKGPLGCNKDRHESIGKGFIGVDCFKFIMEDSRFCNMPLILETPDEKLYFKEIQLLHSFLKPAIKKEEKN